MKNRYEVETYNGMKTITLYGGYADVFPDVLKSESFDRIAFSTGDWEDLDWLADMNIEFKHLLIGGVHCYFNSHKGLDRLKNLESAKLPGKIKGTKLSPLERLKVLHFDWSKNISGQMSSLTQLEHCQISYYGERDASEFSGLKKLKHIDVRMGSLVSLDGIQGCESLEIIELAYLRNLVNLDALGEIENLREIFIEKCSKMSGVNFVHSLKNLEKIWVDVDCGSIKNIDFALGNRKLRQLLLQSQLDDVNWEALLSLPEIDDIRIGISPEKLPKKEDIESMVTSNGRQLVQFEINGTRKRPWVGVYLMPLSGILPPFLRDDW